MVDWIVPHEAIKIDAARLLLRIFADKSAQHRIVIPFAVITHTRRAVRSRSEPNPARIRELQTVFSGARVAAYGKTPGARFLGGGAFARRGVLGRPSR